MANIAFTIKLSKEDRDRFKQIARANGQKPCTVARQMIERYLDQQSIETQEKSAA